MIRHLESGGVSTLLYGGNANLYNIGLYEYGALLDLLEETAAPRLWVIPSAGPDFGKLLDQANVLRGRAFPTAMVLPQTFPATPDGSARRSRSSRRRYGRPVIVYIKSDTFLTPTLVARLVDAGFVAAVKYGTVRADPNDDPFLADLIDRVDRTRSSAASASDPRSSTCAISAWRASRPARCASAPRGSARHPRGAQGGDYAPAEALRAAYLPLEDLRDELSPIRVLHEAVTLAGIADMGPMLAASVEPARRHHFRALGPLRRRCSPTTRTLP